VDSFTPPVDTDLSPVMIRTDIEDPFRVFVYLNYTTPGFYEIPVTRFIFNDLSGSGNFIVDNDAGPSITPYDCEKFNQALINRTIDCDINANTNPSSLINSNVRVWTMTYTSGVVPLNPQPGDPDPSIRFKFSVFSTSQVPDTAVTFATNIWSIDTSAISSGQMAAVVMNGCNSDGQLNEVYIFVNNSGGGGSAESLSLLYNVPIPAIPTGGPVVSATIPILGTSPSILSIISGSYTPLAVSISGPNFLVTIPPTLGPNGTGYFNYLTTIGANTYLVTQLVKMFDSGLYNNDYSTVQTNKSGYNITEIISPDGLAISQDGYTGSYNNNLLYGNQSGDSLLYFLPRISSLRVGNFSNYNWKTAIQGYGSGSVGDNRVAGYWSWSVGADNYVTGVYTTVSGQNNKIHGLIGRFTATYNHGALTLTFNAATPYTWGIGETIIVAPNTLGDDTIYYFTIFSLASPNVYNVINSSPNPTQIPTGNLSFDPTNFTFFLVKGADMASGFNNRLYSEGGSLINGTNNTSFTKNSIVSGNGANHTLLNSIAMGVKTDAITTVRPVSGAYSLAMTDATDTVLDHSIAVVSTNNNNTTNNLSGIGSSYFGIKNRVIATTLTPVGVPGFTRSATDQITVIFTGDQRGTFGLFSSQNDYLAFDRSTKYYGLRFVDAGATDIGLIFAKVVPATNYIVFSGGQTTVVFTLIYTNDQVMRFPPGDARLNSVTVFNSTVATLEGGGNATEFLANHTEGLNNTNRGTNTHVEGQNNDIAGDLTTYIGSITAASVGVSFTVSGLSPIVANKYIGCIEAYVYFDTSTTTPAGGIYNIISMTNTSIVFSGNPASPATIGTGVIIQLVNECNTVSGASNSVTGSFNTVNGASNIMKGSYNYMEGSQNQYLTTTLTTYNHVEGYQNTFTAVDMNYNHIEGTNHDLSNAVLNRTHIEGTDNNISGSNWDVCHIEGSGHDRVSGATGTFTGVHVEGLNNRIGNLTIPVDYSHLEGQNNTVSGSYCHVEGQNNDITFTNDYNHVEGFDNDIINTLSSIYNHLEGRDNKLLPLSTAVINYTHLEGRSNQLSSGTWVGSHIEGNANNATAGATGTFTGVHVEGQSNTVGSGASAVNYVHLEGFNNVTNGSYNHLEGNANRIQTTALSQYNHLEGQTNEFQAGVTATASHIEGGSNVISGGTFTNTHIEGASNNITGGTWIQSHIEGFNNNRTAGATGTFTGVHMEGNTNTVGIAANNVQYTHIEGTSNLSNSNNGHVEGSSNSVYGASAHVEGNLNMVGGDIIPLAVDYYASGSITFASSQTMVTGDIIYFPNPLNSTTVAATINTGGTNTTFTITATGPFSLPTGPLSYPGMTALRRSITVSNTAGTAGHSEGRVSATNGGAGHSENNSISLASNSHSEGSGQSLGTYSHAEGYSSIARAIASHAEGQGTVAMNRGGHAEGALSLSGGTRVDMATTGNYYTTATQTLVLATTPAPLTQVGDVIYFPGNTASTYIMYPCRITAKASEISFTVAALTFDSGYNIPLPTVNLSSSRSLFGVLMRASDGSLVNPVSTPNHAEGSASVAINIGAHAEGTSLAVGTYSHAENNAQVIGNYSHGEGLAIVRGLYNHGEGGRNLIESTVSTSHVEGDNITISGTINASHFEGTSYNISNTTITTTHFEGTGHAITGGTINNSHLEGGSHTIASGTWQFTHLEGNGHSIVASTTGQIDHCHLEGLTNQIGSGSSSNTEASHVEGRENIVRSNFCHSEGRYNINYGSASHTEGYQNTTGGNLILLRSQNIYYEPAKTVPIVEPAILYFNSVQTLTLGTLIYFPNPVDNKTVLAVLDGTINGGPSSFGYYISAYVDNILPSVSLRGTISYAIHRVSNTNGPTAHAEGQTTAAQGQSSHSENNSIAVGVISHSEGVSSAYGVGSHAEGNGSYARADYSHAEGQATTVLSRGSHAEGSFSMCGGISLLLAGTYYIPVSPISGSLFLFNPTPLTALGDIIVFPDINRGILVPAIIESISVSQLAVRPLSADSILTIFLPSVTLAFTRYNLYAVLFRNTVGNTPNNLVNNTSTQSGAHAEGMSSCSTSIGSHSENASLSLGNYSHSEGFSIAFGNYSHSEGFQCLAEGVGCHVEGFLCAATGLYTHVEGNQCLVSGNYCHSEGFQCSATGNYSHVQGSFCLSDGDNSFASGKNIRVTDNCHVLGSFIETIGPPPLTALRTGCVAFGDNSRTISNVMILDNDNMLKARFSGSGGKSYRFETNTGGTAGVEMLSNTNAWIPFSCSKTTKTKISDIDFEDYIERFDRMHLEQWHYNNSPEYKYNTPYLEDYRELIGEKFSNYDYTIDTMELDSISIAAIKGSYMKQKKLKAQVDEQQEIITTQQSQITTMQQQIADLQMAISAIQAQLTK
jgi:hypothetical protein